MRLTFPSWLRWYKKPEYRDIKEYATNVSSGKRPLSPDGRNGSIPSRLRLDRILANKTCSPMSLHDFYMYLKYIEHSEENLEFYMWFKNYEATWTQSLAANSDKEYSSAPSASQSTSSVAHIKAGDSLAWTDKGHDEDDDKDSEAANETLSRISQLISPAALCASKSGACARPTSISLPFVPQSSSSGSRPPKTTTHHLQLLNPTCPPAMQAELSAIIALFLQPNSPKELNLPPALRDRALAGLAHDDDPGTALRPVAEHAYSLLRNCSHRNFVRLGVGNGTFETVCAATLLGGVALAAGLALALCRAAVPFRGAHSRWEAWAAWPLWALGMSLLLCGLRGSCFFLLLFSRRQRLPWERFEDEEDDDEVGVDGDGGEGRNAGTGGGGGGGNSWKGWFRRRGRRWVRALRRLMIFDRRIRVQERHLRRLQRKIVLQSVVGGCVFATVCVALFIWLPVWRETV